MVSVEEGFVCDAYVCIFVCLYLHVAVCVCACLLMPVGTIIFPGSSLELNVRAITCICDSPLSQVRFLCSHMQPANLEFKDADICKTHTTQRSIHT